MSWDYGQNAQSSLLPEKQVQIKVGDKGNQKIKAAILSIKQKSKNQPQTKGAYFNPNTIKQPKKNKGINDRIKRDEEAKQLFQMKDDKSLAVVRQQLQKKQKLYAAQQKNPKRNDSLFLVDFVQKQLSKQDEELQQLKKQFYSGKLEQVLKQQQKIHEGQETKIHDYMRQNLAWEKEVLQELNGQLLVQGKTKVAQSFDRRLTEDEKKALDRVISERLREKERIVEIKKQREQDDMERIRKLKKLNILQDSDQDQDQ